MKAAAKRVRARKRARRPKVGTVVSCPYCGEQDELFVDRGGMERQTYTEDCAVCCRPRVVHVEPGDEAGEITVWLERED